LPWKADLVSLAMSKTEMPWGVSSARYRRVKSRARSPRRSRRGRWNGGRGLGRGQPRDDHPGVGGDLGQTRDQQPQLALGLAEGGAVGDVVGADADQHDVRVQALHLGELVDDDVAEPGAGDAEGVQA
jgi:hypothetical protein